MLGYLKTGEVSVRAGLSADDLAIYFGPCYDPIASRSFVLYLEHTGGLPDGSGNKHSPCAKKEYSGQVALVAMKGSARTKAQWY